MATTSLLTRPIGVQIYITEEATKTPISSLDTRKNLAAILIEQMDELASCKETKRCIIHVAPKETDLDALDVKLNRQFAQLTTLISASDLKISKSDGTLQRFKTALLVADHDIRSADDYDHPALPLQLVQNLASCKELQDTVETNLTVIEENLERLSLSQENPSLSFKPGFVHVACSIAASPKKSHTLQSGGSGKTELIVHENEICYVKKAPLRQSEKIAKIFANEIFISYSLPEHPGIVSFYGVNKERELLLEYIPDEDLLTATKDDLLSFDQKYTIAEKSAEALAFLHASGLIHCDVKLENLVLDLTLDQPMLIDFGLCRHKFESSENISRIGTPNYIAPEMLSTNLPKDNKIDVFSYGCSLYTLLAKKIFWNSLYSMYGKTFENPTSMFDFLKNNQRTLQKNISTMLKTSKNKLKNIGFPDPKLNKLFEVLKVCLQVDANRRATMKEVVAMFKRDE